jgi:ketosteroid isomerase-like protein
MAEESATPDLVELTRRAFEAANRRDVDAGVSFYAPDAVYESVGMGASFEGVAAIREYLGDFGGAYDEFGLETDEILDLGNGVTLAVVDQKGRPHGSSGEVQMRYAAVAIWVEGMIERFTTYTDIDEGRAAAERLAEERGG